MKRIACIIAIIFSLQPCCPARGAEYPGRIISLSPSITEILYGLGLGERVVGVTDHCNFPDEVRSKPRVGSYLSINYESIMLLEPDLVVVLDGYGPELRDTLDKAGIERITVNTSTIDGIFSSIQKIGRRCRAEESAAGLISRIKEDVNKLKNKAKRDPPRRVMVVVGRNSGSFENLYIAGRNTFYNELLELLGCENVYEKADISYPAISLEGVIRLNPDIIIEMLPGYPDDKISEVTGEWNIFEHVSAVRNGKVFVFNEDYVCVPGPRFTLVLRKMAEAL